MEYREFGICQAHCMAVRGRLTRDLVRSWIGGRIVVVFFCGSFFLLFLLDIVQVFCEDTV